MEDMAKKVHAVMMDCLYKSEEIEDLKPGDLPEGAVQVQGIVRKYALHPGRLESHRQNVLGFIGELPDEFTVGGGWSFLNLCMDRHGEQWGEQTTGEALMVLAMGLGLASYPLPREFWNFFPGGVPYVTFKAA